MQIPFVDLSAQYQSIKQEIDAAILKVIEETAFIGGKFVSEFELNFRQFLQIDHVIACANGTDSLEIILKAYNIGYGDEVLVPAVSWISTSEAVSSTGAVPVFVDIDPYSYTIDVALIEQKITPKTKAIIPVHLYGNPADIKAIMTLAKKFNLVVIEDCAQAHGAEVDGKMVGTFGHAASFSFYPGKNLGAFGDAGAMVTHDPEIAKKLRMIANHGQLQKHTHLIEGRNSRMDGLQAAILSVKIKHLPAWTLKRIKNATRYTQLLQSTRIKTPQVKNNCKHVFHLYVIQVENRDLLQKHLEHNNIGTAIHYPVALPFLDAYKPLQYKKADFPVAVALTENSISIPMYPELSEKMIDDVVNAIIFLS